MNRTESIKDQLDAEFAEAWRPAPGDKLVGTVTAISERDGAFGRYPIVTLHSDGGEDLAVHAFHEVLQNELARIAPKIGDELGIKYEGKDAERGYHRYRVRRAGEDGVEWSRYGMRDEDLQAAASTQGPLGVESDGNQV